MSHLILGTDSRNKEEQEKSLALTLDRLLFLVDENTLIRLGLGLIETFAQAERRVLWH